MLTILLSLISIFNGTAQLPQAEVEVAEAEVEVAEAEVEVAEAEVEAVFVPADWSGPVVAAPFDEAVF